MLELLDCRYIYMTHYMTADTFRIYFYREPFLVECHSLCWINKTELRLTRTPASVLTRLVEVVWRWRREEVAEDVTWHHVPDNRLPVIARGGQEVGQTLGNSENVFLMAICLKLNQSYDYCYNTHKTRKPFYLHIHYNTKQCFQV